MCLEILYSMYVYKQDFRPGLISRMFANGLEDRGSILGRVIPKTQKWYVMQPCLTLSIIR